MYEVRCTGQPGSIPTMHSAFILGKPNRTLYYHGTHRAPYGILTHFLRVTSMYESIFYWICFLTRLGPVVCCWWLCLEVKKRLQIVRTRGFVRFINTVHRRETVEKQRFHSDFVRAPRKSVRTVRNRGFVRFIHTVHRGEKRCCTVFPTESGAAP